MKKLAWLIAPIIALIIFGLIVFGFWKSPAPLSSSSNAPAGPVSASPPIILIHGFNQDSDFWDDISLIKELRAKDYLLMGEFYSDDSHQLLLRNQSPISQGQSACYKLALPAKGTKDIRDSGILLEKTIQAITATHHCNKVKLISFSAGGVVCREYLSKHLDDHQVSTLITVSSPHMGSEHAWLADGFHSIQSALNAFQANQSGNALMRFSRHYTLLGMQSVTDKIQQWSLKAGVDINSACARMLARPETGNYLDQLSRAPHPSDIDYHCVITEENIFNYDVSSLKADFAKLKKGNLSSMDLATTVLDLGRYGLGKLDKITEQFSSLKFRGDGVVSRFSQDLNNIHYFKNTSELSASTSTIETHHGGPEICSHIIHALNFPTTTVLKTEQ